MAYLPFDEAEYYAQMDGNPGATDMDAVREYARNVGLENQEREWILDPRDCWTRNPFYAGKPGRHPEDDSDEVDDNACAECGLSASYGHAQWCSLAP